MPSTPAVPAETRARASAVRRGQAPHVRARVDQSAADIAEAFDLLGLDLHEPAVAAGAFTLATIFVARLAETDDPEVLLHVLTSRIAEAYVALAEHVAA